MTRFRPHLISACSGLGLIGLWAMAAWLGDDPATLPGPGDVMSILINETLSGELWRHLSATLLRVVAAFVIAMSLGTCLGVLMGRSARANQWLNPWLIVLLNLPALVTIVLAYVWIGLNEVAAILAVAANKIPLVTVMLREAARDLDPALDDLTKVFRMSASTRLRHVLVPQLAPSLASAARAGLSLIWKIVLVVEFLGRYSGVGFQIHQYFQLWDIGHVLAYGLSFVLVMLLIEYLVLQPIEQRSARWRRDED